MIVTSDTDLAAAAIAMGYELADPAFERRGSRMFWRIETNEDLEPKFYVQGEGDFAVARRTLAARKFLIAKAKASN